MLKNKMFSKVLQFGIVFFVSFCFCSIELGAVEHYSDTTLSIDNRLDDLIPKMTLQEKIAQLGHQSPSISHLGISSYNYWNEAIHGVARAGLATSFPVSIALSSTWDPNLIYNVATAISDEARIKNNLDRKGLTYWSPTINMARDPRWGRSEENYGEDVFLTTQIAINFIKGMQGDDPNYLKTVATAKHFACNNIEHNRYGISSDVDERSLREYYLPAFKACVMDADVYSIMSAYNAVNGVPSPANRTLLTHILRDEWGFEGFVVSDCDAVYNVSNDHKYVPDFAQASAISLLNGNDLNCGTTFPDNISAALSKGLLAESDIDSAIKRVFKARFLLGEFDPPAAVPYTNIPASRLDCQENKDLALNAARKSIVLLKNYNSFLPLDRNNIESIALIGPNANVVQLGGYSGSPSIQVSPLQGVADLLGVNIFNGLIEAETYIDQSGVKTESSEDGGSNVGYINNGDYCVYDSIDFNTGKGKIDFRVASGTSGGTIEVTIDNLNGQSLGSFSMSGTGSWQTWSTLSYDLVGVSGKHKVYLKYSGSSGYLFNLNWFKIYNEGDIDPLEGNGIISFAQGCSINGAKDQSEFDKAVEFAKKSDVAIVVVGTDLTTADESNDRSSLNLPGVQEQLIKEVFRANPNTIVVLVTGASLAVNWAQDSVPAIVCSWYNGQAQGTALADVIFGEYNPGGKLSTTWYKSTNDLPKIEDYDIKNNRTYMYFNGIPLYPFGYGLSYTQFEYSKLNLSSEYINERDSILVSAEIKNSGEHDGDEVVQMYVKVLSSHIKRPAKELKGFSRINVPTGETKLVEFYLNYKDLQYFDPITKTFKVENAPVVVMLGSSSSDIRLMDTISVSEGTVDSTYTQNPFNPLEAENLEGKTRYSDFITNENGGLSVRSTYDGYICFKHLNFNSDAFQFNAMLSTINEDISIDIILDSPSGESVGKLKVNSTGSIDKYELQSCVLSGIKGVRDVYLKINNVSSPVYIDWVNFQENITVAVNSINTNVLNNYNCQLYPNPANDLFTINYILPEVSDVEIGMYSLQGSLIRNEFYTKRPAGSNNTEFKVVEKNLSTGLYVVKFQTKNFQKALFLNIMR